MQQIYYEKAKRIEGLPKTFAKGILVKIQVNRDQRDIDKSIGK